MSVVRGARNEFIIIDNWRGATVPRYRYNTTGMGFEFAN